VAIAGLDTGCGGAILKSIVRYGSGERQIVSLGGGDMASVTFLGHSCVMVEGGGKKILIDPFLTDNPQASTSADEIACDFIVVTHAHGDHVGDTVAIAKRTGAMVITNFEIHNYCVAQGVQSAHPLHIGGAYDFPFGRAKLTIAHHGSSFPDGSYGGNPAGVLLTVEGKIIYHTGDTALTHDMKLYGDEGVDLAFVPIGGNFTMDIPDAVRAVEFIRPKCVIPIHYSTFDIINADPQEFKSAVSGSGVECVILPPGESWALP